MSKDRYRGGTKNPKTIYWNDEPIGYIDEEWRDRVVTDANHGLIHLEAERADQCQEDKT